MVQMKVDTIEELAIILVGIDDRDYHTEHPISTSNKYGIDDQIKPYIDDYERIGVKPAAMLIGLKEKTENLPTVVQLKIYLKRLRNNREGNRGSRITLNDLLEFYEEHKNEPEDLDKMSVVDCFCDASTKDNEIVFKFRIFMIAKFLGVCLFL
jgi:hypothetical protein